MKIESQYVIYKSIGNCHQLIEPFVFKMHVAPGYSGKYGFVSFDADGWVICDTGFTWNGANGPTMDTLDSLPASCGHDGIAELIDAGLLPKDIYRDVSNQWFYLRLRKDGMFDFRAFYWFSAVDKFYIPKGYPDEIRRAPVPFCEKFPQEKFDINRRVGLI